MRFDNQVVMITGAAGSLGKAVAAGFAAGGARLALADVSEAVLQQAYPGTADTRLLLRGAAGQPARLCLGAECG
jgi:NAD(P)-dependent dehydrogenase (short-subunit alcohol dehydrogenase family)